MAHFFEFFKAHHCTFKTCTSILLLSTWAIYFSVWTILLYQINRDHLQQQRNGSISFHKNEEQ